MPACMSDCPHIKLPHIVVRCIFSAVLHATAPHQIAPHACMHVACMYVVSLASGCTGVFAKKQHSIKNSKTKPTQKSIYRTMQLHACTHAVYMLLFTHWHLSGYFQSRRAVACMHWHAPITRTKSQSDRPVTTINMHGQHGHACYHGMHRAYM